MDLDWQFTQQWPGDPTLGGYVPRVGEHVVCHRAADGATRCGIVDDNRAGLFLTTCSGGRVVLTAERWAVTPVGAACQTGPMLTIPADLKSRPRSELWSWYEEVVRTPGRILDEKEQAYDAVCAALPKLAPLPPGALSCGHMEPEECDIDCRI